MCIETSSSRPHFSPPVPPTPHIDSHRVHFGLRKNSFLAVANREANPGIGLLEHAHAREKVRLGETLCAHDAEEAFGLKDGHGVHVVTI
jgi:hypothetical protein